MALSTERKQELAGLHLPSDLDVVQRAIVFQQRAGLTMAEFSQAIGFAASTLGVYLHGNYSNNLTADHDGSRNTANIRARLTEYMDQWEGAQASRAARAPHMTRDLRRIVECSLQALEHGSAYVIDGPPGTQKTFSLRAAESHIREQVGGARVVYIYARQDHTPLSFLREICNSACVSNRGDIDQVLRKLRFFLGDRRVLLMIDEAQHLPHKTLEILRQLLDLPPYFGIVLAGSHDLSERLADWQMEQWRSRLREKLYLNGPSKAEARAIIRAELEPIAGAHSDADCDAIIADCIVRSKRMDRNSEKPRSRSFEYISARDLFYSIEGIQQKLTATSRPAPQKESAA